jgi:hypothetical protein
MIVTKIQKTSTTPAEMKMLSKANLTPRKRKRRRLPSMHQSRKQKSRSRRGSSWEKSMAITKLELMFRLKYKSRRNLQGSFNLTIQLFCAALSIRKLDLHSCE